MNKKAAFVILFIILFIGAVSGEAVLIKHEVDSVYHFTYGGMIGVLVSNFVSVFMNHIFRDRSR